MAEKVFRLLCCALVVVLLCLINRANGTIYTTSCDSATNGTETCRNEYGNAECKANSCSCKATYVLTTDKQACKKAFGQQCTTNDDCVINGECTGADGAKTCACKSGYTHKDDACTEIIGMACTTNGNCSNDANAECKDNTCQCKTGYNGKNVVCTKVMDMTCTSDSDCSSLTNSVCTNDMCACATNYTKENVVCKTADGQSCTENADCVMNGECTGADGSKTCGCKSDYELKDGLCQGNSAQAVVLSVGLLLVPLLVIFKNLL